MALFNDATNGSSGRGWSAWSHKIPLVLDDAVTFQTLSFKDRVEHAGALTATAGLFPPYVYVYHATRLLLYIVSCTLLLVTDKTHSESWLAPGFVRITMWTALLEICGFCNLTGPLGAGQATLAPLWYRLTTGTLKQPLLSCLPRKRGRVDVFLFVVYVASAVSVSMCRTLEQHPRRIRVAVGLLSALCISDRSAFTGSCGAYYFPLLVCQAYGGKCGLFGCQLVQLAHLMMAGVGKLGPWFRLVTPSMLGVCPVAPRWAKDALFAKGADGGLDVLKPSLLSDCLTHIVVILELGLPLLMASVSHAWRIFGVCFTVALHLYIVLQFAPGAVGEWNMFNAMATAYLFGIKQLDFSPWSAGGTYVASEWALILYVVLAVYAAPLVGNWKPDCIGNHFTLRKYTGNHPYHTFLVRRSAVPKLNGFRTFGYLAAGKCPSPQADFLSCAALHSLVRGRLNLRRLLDILPMAVPEDPELTLEDFVRFDLGFLFSQNLLDVTFLDGQLLALLREARFLPGELMSLRVSSFPTCSAWPHQAPWEVLDVGAGTRKCSGFVCADETFTIDA